MKTLVAVLLLTSVVWAQPRLEFEVATIKPADPAAQGTRFQLQPGGKVVITNATLRQVIMQAYQLREFQLEGGPAWAGTERFDIQATSNEAFASLEGLKQPELEGIRDRMLARARSLLADRFGVVVKKNLKEQPVYALTVAKGGSKLKPPTGEVSQRSTSVRAGDGGHVRLVAKAVDMDTLRNTLAGQLERAVVDRTGLAGIFDLEAEWVQDLAKDADGPSVFTAMQEQLGLKLESTKAPVEVWTIEKAEHPSEN